MKNHYDVRSIYSTEIGRSLAYTADRALIRTAILGARNPRDRFDDNTASSPYLGSTLGAGSTGGDLVDALFIIAQRMDEKNVPSNDRYCILPPAKYYQLVSENTDAINRDFNHENNGSVASGMVMSVAGIRILKSNHLPNTNETSPSALFGGSAVKNDPGGTAGTGYSGADFSTTAGLVFQREGLATVKLMDLSVESEYIMERMGTLMLAKYAMGHSVLRNECCHELTTAALP
jgi:hypothetical protein